ncbi:MAG: hypothetical protein QOI54_3091 [Actinomycetota bacterium]|nr:hypothetical protein [Actinomycetota bacterium]
MYGWIWRHLPGPLGLRLLLATTLVLGAVALLFTVVFPWTEHGLPFLNVTVNQ